MQRRSFEKSSWFLVVAGIALVVALLAGMYRVAAAPPEAPPEAPSAALLAVSWRTTLITVATVSASSLTQNYAYQDVACSFDFHKNQRVTVTLESSLDDIVWAQTVSFAGITTDTITTTVVFSRVLSYGRYERMAIDTSTNYPVTPTCKSVFFNNWMPGGSGNVVSIR